MMFAARAVVGPILARRAVRLARNTCFILVICNENIGDEKSWH